MAPARSTCALIAIFLCGTGLALAQTQTQTAKLELPDAPVAAPALSGAAEDGGIPGSGQESSSNSPSATSQATVVVPPAQRHSMHIPGLASTYRSVSADSKPPRQTVKDKFGNASEDAFSVPDLGFAALAAAESYARNATPEFGTGGVGYSRYLWHSFADRTVEIYMVEFIIPVPTHEDTRYYTLGHGSFGKRFGYALGHVLVTRSDSGKKVFNAGEVIGAGAAAGVSNLYYPSPERTLTNTVQGWGLNIGLDALTFAVKEFWPDKDSKGSLPKTQLSTAP